MLILPCAPAPACLAHPRLRAQQPACKPPPRQLTLQLVVLQEHSLQTQKLAPFCRERSRQRVVLEGDFSQAVSALPRGQRPCYVAVRRVKLGQIAGQVGRERAGQHGVAQDPQLLQARRELMGEAEKLVGMGLQLLQGSRELRQGRELVVVDAQPLQRLSTV